MKKKYFIFIAILAFGLLSCEKGELLNAEADIEKIILPDELNSLVGSPIYSNNVIRIPKTAISEEDQATLESLLENLTVQFILTEGASISPDPNEPRDFTEIQKYTVTSQDGKWKKEYSIYFYYARFVQTQFDFELARLSPPPPPPATGGRYYEFFEMNNHEEQKVWASGNPGFAMAAGTRPPEEYPTISVANSRSGKGLKLTTRSTGTFGQMARMPIAAGNLFLGNFETENAMKDALRATQFGVQTTLSKPKSLEVWAKYKPGEKFAIPNGTRPPIEVLGKIDKPDVYAVFFEPEKDNDGKPIMLDGANVKTAPNIVAIAAIGSELAETLVADDIDNATYKFVSIPFVFKQDFDVAKQVRGEYYFTIVMSSSENGASFEGAVGSTLYVDEVRLVLE